MEPDTKGGRGKRSQQKRPPSKEEKAAHVAEVKAEADGFLAQLDELLEGEAGEETEGEGEP
jgi:hypothetical protein